MNDAPDSRESGERRERGISAYARIFEVPEQEVPATFAARVGPVFAEAAAHLTPGDIKLIVVTHAHADHAGSAAELRAMTGAPVAVHRADAAALTAGGPITLQPTGPAGRAMRPMMRAPLPPLVPDIQLEDLTDLAQYDLSGTVLSTPGHTAGSISIALDNGDLLVGDALSGGLVRTSRPGMPLFAANSDLTRHTIGKLAEHRPRLVHPGHGSPIAGDRLAGLAARLAA